MVPLAQHLSEQAPGTRTQGARRGRLDDRVVLPARHPSNDQLRPARREIPAMRRSPALFLAIGSVIGALGAFVLARVGLSPAGWSVVAILLGAVLGGCFALMTRSRATTPGAGLLWALAFSFLLWLAGPACMLPRVTSHGRMGLVGSSSPGLGKTLHFVIAVIIGATFGLLFQRDVRGYGSSLGWGLAYGIFWWFLGPLTLKPLLQWHAPNWSLARGQELFGSLMGHIVYGLIVGVIYAALDRLWVGFFIDSDPINRQPEGPGSRALLSLGRGSVAGLIGGLVFWPQIVAVDGLPWIARLAGGTSSAVGLVVHLSISVAIRAGYGVLFERESPDWGAAVGWGDA